MPGPALTVDQNILPVQAYFNLDGTFNTLIGQGQPFVITATESIGIVNTNVNATLYPTFTSATSGQVTGLAIASPSLTWNPGTGVFSAPTFFGALNGTASTATNFANGAAGQIPYQTGANTTSFIATGTTGQFLKSNGSSAPTWATVSTSITISDQTTDTATYYPIFYSATSGSTNILDTSSTKLQYQPSTGTFTATLFSGSGASLTNIPNSALTNSSVTIGSTSIALGGTSTTLAGLTSVTATTFTGSLSGNANTATTATNATNSAITDNTSSSATYYPTLVTSTSGNQPLNTSSTKLSFVPSTGVLSANGVALTGNLGTVTSVAATVPSFLSITGSPITSSGTLAISYSGTALPAANGGTGQTSAFVAGGIVYGSSTTALAVTAIGTTGQALLSNGASAPTWGTITQGVVWQSVQTANFTAVAGNGYPVNTTSGSILATLPASPSVGQLVTILDYAGTAATNNIVISPNGNKIQGNVGFYMLSVNRQSANFVYIDSTQGWVSYADQSIALNPQPYTATYLVVAGGASGGTGYAGGGGGAGGLLTGTQILTNGTTYSFVVGAGGAAQATPTTNGNNGSNSTALGLTAIGGGGGGKYGSIGNNGGSGGGNGGVSATTPAAGTSGQGNAGGKGANFTVGAGSGGGGGAGAVGGDSGANDPGPSGSGGIGLTNSITGTSTYYAGGGGGGAYFVSVPVDTPGAGGLGGGGAGGVTGGGNGFSGTVNTGGGGGGTSGITRSSGAGGSGVVIISVLTANYTGTVTGSPTVTTNGANTIMTFTSSGSYTA